MALLSKKNKLLCTLIHFNNIYDNNLRKFILKVTVIMLQPRKVLLGFMKMRNYRVELHKINE